MNNTILTSMIFLLVISNASAFDKGSPLMNAVDKKNFKEVVSLVESGANVNQKNDIGSTALLIASSWGDVKMVKYLIKHGASLDARANLGFSVIHRAAMNKDSSVLKYLLEHYSLDVNDRGQSYCSPLDYSLRNNALQNYGSLNNAQLLLEKGAKKSINWKCNGYTPLMVSVSDKQAINLLIKNGADKNIQNKAGFTAYDMAKDQHVAKDILSILVTKTEDKKSTRRTTFASSNLLWELKTAKNRYHSYTEDDAIKYCSNLHLDGYNNWRIPSTDEYQTILSKKPYKGFVIDGVTQYYMNPKDFPYMTPTSYWVTLEDNSLGYQSISWNNVHKIRENREKHNIRCVHAQ